MSFVLLTWFYVKDHNNHKKIWEARRSKPSVEDQQLLEVHEGSIQEATRRSIVKTTASEFLQSLLTQESVLHHHIHVTLIQQLLSDT